MTGQAVTRVLDKRPAKLSRLPDLRYKAVDRRRRLDCILTRPFGHWKRYDPNSGHWTCQCCGAVGTYDPIGYM